jgi:hypothetical protein
MTPSLLGDALLRPRLFVHGDVAAAFAYQRNLAGVGGPGKFTLPSGQLAPRGIDPATRDLQEELEIPGQGSRTHMKVGRWVWSGGGGIAFTVEAFHRTFRIKPSFEYLRQELEFNGVVNRAVKLRVPSGVADLRNIRQISLTKFATKSYDGFGPGLELEVDTVRLGPIVPSLFILGRGYYLMGSLSESLTATNEFGESATWTAEPNRWVWRGGIGIRFRWLPGPE